MTFSLRLSRQGASAFVFSSLALLAGACGSSTPDNPSGDGANDGGATPNEGGFVNRAGNDGSTSADAATESGTSRGSTDPSDSGNDFAGEDGSASGPLGDDSGSTNGDDAGSVDSGTGDGATDPGIASIGSLVFSQTEHGGGAGATTYTYYGNASFYSYSTVPVDAGSASTCTSTPLAGTSCRFVVCPNTNMTPTPPAPEEHALSAGELTITGGNLPQAGVTSQPDSTTDAYPSISGSTEAFAAGQTLTFSAAGAVGSVQAFNLSVAVPGDVAFTNPIVTIGTPDSIPAIPRSRDLNATWRGGTAGANLAIYVETIATATNTLKYVGCTFEAGLGTGTIPSSNGLANLDSADGRTVYGYFTSDSSTTGNVSVPNHDASVARAGNVNVTATIEGSGTVATFTTSD